MLNNIPDIKKFLNRYGLYNNDYTINGDLSVDVKGDVDISHKNLSKTTPLDEIPVKFGKVTGSFNVSQNELTSLYGSPDEVGKNFYCGFNKLTDLEYSPKLVKGSFMCHFNKKLKTLKGIGKVLEGFNVNHSLALKSLEFIPQMITSLDVSFCGIKDLVNCPQNLLNLDISNNKLDSLKGCPTKLFGDFTAINCTLKTLEFCPQEVEGFFYIYSNPIKSLEHCPKIIKSYFTVMNCDLENLDFFPERVVGAIDVSDNNISFIPDDVWEIFLEKNAISDFNLAGNPLLDDKLLVKAYKPIMKKARYTKQDIVKDPRKFFKLLDDKFITLSQAKLPMNIWGK